MIFIITNTNKYSDINFDDSNMKLDTLTLILGSTRELWDAEKIVF